MEAQTADHPVQYLDTPPHDTISNVNESSLSVHLCVVCLTDGAELYCITCHSKPTPYHIKCWADQVLHRPNRTPLHRQIHLQDMERLTYINEPNVQESIKWQTFNDDDENRLIEFNHHSHRLVLGRRARPLLRHDNIGRSPQHPSFVSFIGHTMSGKSFLIRAILHGSPAEKFPSPIPAPGAKEHNFSSTSCDINLYADWKTADEDSPILFLDCEGLEGSTSPIALSVKTKNAASNPVRRTFVENAYPRFIYTFSTCVVFVTSRPLGSVSVIGKQLISYASSGAGGSQNQRFRPSLFVVFNRSEAGETSDFDWSIPSSTQKFLEHDELKDLGLFYSAIFVVYIPLTHKDKSDIALSQIDAFQRLLREEHMKAFIRRRDFNLALPAAELQNVLYRAVDVFSKNSNPVFNWSIEATRGEGKSNVHAIFEDLWTQCTKHFSDFADPERSGRELYHLTRTTFEAHVKFCLLLAHSRRLQPGIHFTAITKDLEEMINITNEILRVHAPCNASTGKTHCRETNGRHANYHQGVIKGSNKALRWRGPFQGVETAKSPPFRTIFEDALKETPGRVSLHNLGKGTLPAGICSFTSCFGCLQVPPNVVLACRHAFCFDCIRDLANSPQPHRLKIIPCPFHKSLERFSPRLLPIESGYRVLCLDGGGVKGLAELLILRHIEKRCFEIPTVELYDLIVGTSVGGQIALTLTAPGHGTPLTVAQGTEKFKEMMSKGFVRKTPKLLLRTGIPWLLNKTTYKASVVERQLHALFGHKEILQLPWPATYAKADTVPNVAVTTVPLDTFKAHLVTNYNRSAESGVCPLLAGSECMQIWTAARCTSAALPYFKAVTWQGQMLLDGGFQVNCPASVASSEAAAIWPEKRRDILVSLGTGMSKSEEKKSSNILQVYRKAVQLLTHSEDIWSKFKHSLQEDAQLRVFRLNPEYTGSGFALDDFQKLDEIEKQTKNWLATQNSKITLISNRLIAALFFFVQTSWLENNKLTGDILCRLPVDLDARKRLFQEMGKKPNSTLFEVDIIDQYRPILEIQAGSLAHCGIGDELRIPVELFDIPDEGQVAIQITMLNFRENADSIQFPISGSPYVLRQR